MKVDSAYISVKDRKRAEAYWKRVFGIEPAMKSEIFTFFDLSGFLFGLFDSAAVAENINYGNNCVINLHVEDADVEAVRLGEFSKIVMPVNSVGPYRVFQVEDTEGNVVEFYSETVGG